MDETIHAPRRRIEPIVHVRGAITHWKCSDCRWTLPTHPEFTGLAPSAYVIEQFKQHDCAEHIRDVG